MIEQVGGVEGVYRAEKELSENFLVRRTAGNVIEAIGIVAFRASPVWVLAALADVCGMGRVMIPEIAGALKAEGLLDPSTQFTSVDQMLDGLKRHSARLAATMNTPPLDVAGLRHEWEAIRESAQALQPASLPSGEAISDLWKQLELEAARQNRSVFETSSLMALSTVRGVPEGVRWLSASTKAGATRTGQILRLRCWITTRDACGDPADGIRRVWRAATGSVPARSGGSILPKAPNAYRACDGQADVWVAGWLRGCVAGPAGG